MKKELKSIADRLHSELLASTDKFNKALNLKPRESVDKNLSISKEQAIKKAINILADRIADRLEIVNKIEGTLYNADKLDLENSWIIRVKPEVILVEWNEYILINKKTGEAMSIRTS